jgi:hypothetical protein
VTPPSDSELTTLELATLGGEEDDMSRDDDFAGVLPTKAVATSP